MGEKNEKTMPIVRAFMRVLSGRNPKNMTTEPQKKKGALPGKKEVAVLKKSRAPTGLALYLGLKYRYRDSASILDLRKLWKPNGHVITFCQFWFQLKAD